MTQSYLLITHPRLCRPTGLMFPLHRGSGPHEILITAFCLVSNMTSGFWVCLCSGCAVHLLPIHVLLHGRLVNFILTQYSTGYF